MISVTGIDKSIFLNSDSVKMLPVVSAEWNQNIFNPPYATIAGDGIKQTGLSTSSSISAVTDLNAKSGFTTKSFSMTADGNTITYTVTPTGSYSAFKIITYVKTNSDLPIMANFSAVGSSNQFGASNQDVNAFGYTKVETYIGSSSSSDIISSFTYTITLNRYSTDDSLPITFYFTEPEVYSVGFFDYQYSSTWPTDSVFTGFRPGESYVNTGNSNFSFESNFRKVNTSILDGYTNDVYMPVSPLVRSPGFFNVSPPVPIYKNALPTDINQYKYFVSDTSNTNITGLYDKSGIMLNKLVIKFNAIATSPVINIYIDDVKIQVDGSYDIDLSLNNTKEYGGKIENSGILVIYWNGTSWTRSRWATMPKINANGTISIINSLKKVRVNQTGKNTRTEFASYSSTYASTDLSRMQVVEVSPRVEIDLTDYVESVSINKSLDAKNTYLPISSINSDDVSVVLAGMPLGNISSPVPIFSNASNYSNSVLKNMLTKNIKLYVNFYLDSYSSISTNGNVSVQKLIPGGIFYSDTWSETDIQQISVQAYDISRYLQSSPVSDYVANLKTPFDVISNFLDLSGFTDYDYDSLYEVCSNKNITIDLAYFYVNSKDTTVIDALSQIFLPYQIGAYINEYGVMKFLSLSKILNAKTSDIDYTDMNVVQNGYSITSKAKPGKISLRYQSPKIKQSLALQNATVPDITNSPSFVYTTSNDVVWSQQNLDSVGLNYLAETMSESSNKFKLQVNDLLDIFHTYSLNNNGFAAIENEIVSFTYKQYTISSQNHSTTVNVKNDIELGSEIDRFNKKYQVGLKVSDGTTKSDYNTVISPTGYITNVQRGLFGTPVTKHEVINSGNFANKNLSCKTLTSGNTISGSGTYSILNGQIQITTPSTGKTLLYPSVERSLVNTDSGQDFYKTYSAKFNFVDSLQLSAGGVFFNLNNSETNANNAYFVELIRSNTINDATSSYFSPPAYNYYLALYTVSSLNTSLVAWTNITATAGNIINNFEKVLVKSVYNGVTTYNYASNPAYQSFKMKVVIGNSDGTDGEVAGNNMTVYLNNNQVYGWQTYQNSKWLPLPINTTNNLPQKIVLSQTLSANTIFGSFISTNPISIPGVSYPAQANGSAGGIREIYATYKPLKERSVSYYYQDRDFLNGLVQNQNVFSKSKSYMMQTTPEVVGINYYDVQYTTPAAVSVDVLPVEYLWLYFPGADVEDQKYVQQQEVDEYSLAYSTPINTGFRAKMAIANNSTHMVYLKKDSDELNQFAITLNLWTHEIIAPSDPEIIEKIIYSGNMSETVQLDSNWIQSKESANKLLNTIALGIDNFSKDVSLEVFGNPLIQVGDVLGLTYNLTGINQQKYIVHSVSHSFSQGFSTKLTLNPISRGISY
jgi:hypothetical protein